jgi:SIR2-like domain
MPEAIRRLDDEGWKGLLLRIRDGRCTPILGNGIYSEGPSLRTDIAQKWAKDGGYPFADGRDLARVARFVSVEAHDAEYAAAKYVEELDAVAPPEFGKDDEPYTVLARLPLPIYITTNYDNFMEEALTKQKRDVKTDLCRWIKPLYEPSPLVDNNFQPSVASPSVFHLYGYKQSLPSMVMTEDDYFQFLINVSKEPEVIPLRIQRAIAGNSLILLGYSLEDWDFRVLFHFLAGYLKNTTSKTHVAVQISPLSTDAPEDLKLRAQAFFDKYFDSKTPDIRVTWDTTQEFVTKLRDKWLESGYAT